MTDEAGQRDSSVKVHASDAEREAVVERLRVATAEGRLTFGELAERTEAAYTATTRGELVPLRSLDPDSCCSKTLSSLVLLASNTQRVGRLTAGNREVVGHDLALTRRAGVDGLVPLMPRPAGVCVMAPEEPEEASGPAGLSGITLDPTELSVRTGGHDPARAVSCKPQVGVAA